MLKGHGEPAFIMQIQTGSLQIEDDLSGVRDAASAHAALLADDAPTDPALLKAVALAAIHAELRSERDWRSCLMTACSNCWSPQRCA